jgi:hypothetical protein
LKEIVLGLGALSLSLLSPTVTASGGSRDSTTTHAASPGTSASVAARPGLGRIDFEQAAGAGVRADVLSLALQAASCATRSGAIEAPPTLTLIDYSRPSVEHRLWVFDLETGDLLFSELVAHGKNTGENLAVSFSNEPDSLKSSLGLFVTQKPYVGSNGYSLRLDGLDVGFNDRARERAIVMHGARYVNPLLGAKQGRIGRSWGCPALSLEAAPLVINRIQNGGVVFSYYPDDEWLTRSRFLQACG